MPDTDPIHGWMFQSNLFLLYLIRGVFSGYSFRLGTEISEGKKLDDVVYEWTEGEIKKYLLFQAKSRIKQNEKIKLEELITSSDSDFSLGKYFFSYMDSKTEELFTKGVIESVILFTNIDLDCKLLESKSIFDEKNYDAANIPEGLRIIFQNYGDGGKIYKLRKEVSALLKPKLLNYNLTRLATRLVKCVLSNTVIKHHDENDIFFYYHKVLASEVLDIQKKKFKDAFISGEGFKEEAKTFREEFIQILNKKSEGKLKLENINEALNKKEIIKDGKPIGLSFSKKFGVIKSGDDKTWPKNAITDDDIKEFCNVFILAANQPNEEDLGKIVKSEIEEKYNLNPSTVNNIYNSLFMSTLRRIQGKFNNKFLSFQEAKKVFEDFISNPSIYFEFKYSNPQFVGREKELKELHEKLTRRNGNNLAVISQMTTVSGLGGIGKSELSKKYSFSYLDFYKDVIWINAETENSLQQSFEKLAVMLYITLEDSTEKKKDINSIVAEVYKWFDNRKTLIIFDNAENCEFLQKFLPLEIPPNQSKPYILITTRDQNWPNLDIINLDVLNENDSKMFIKSYLEINDNFQDNDINNLVNELQGFPLALQQAVAHIKYEQNLRGNSNFTIKDYVKEFQERKKNYLNSNSFRFILQNDYTKTTYTTWKITFKKITENEFGDLALKILYVIAYLNPNNIPVKIFLSKVEEDDYKLWNAVGLLNRFSMIKIENGFVNVHRLVQEVIRIDLKEQNKNEDVLRDVFKVLDEHDLDNPMLPLITLLQNFQTSVIYFKELASEKEGSDFEEYYIKPLYLKIRKIHFKLRFWESRLSLLFLIRGVFLGYSCRLYSEIYAAKKFDDIVLELAEEDENKYILSKNLHKLNEQAKIRTENLITVNDGDFSLGKYFFSYQDSKKEKNFKNGTIQNVILCTNIDFDYEDLKATNVSVKKIDYSGENIKVLNILKDKYGDGGLIYRFDKGILKLLKPKLLNYNLTRLARRLVECILNNTAIRHHEKYDIFFYYHKVLASEVLDIPNKRFKDNFISGEGIEDEAKIFREECIQILNKKSVGKLKLENINQAIRNEEKVIGEKPIGLNFSKKFGMGDDKSWPKNAITNDELEEFLNVLILAVNQPNEDRLKKIIEIEIREIYNLYQTTARHMYNINFQSLLNLLQGKETSDSFFSPEEANELLSKLY